MTAFVADLKGRDIIGVIELHDEGAYLLIFDRADMGRPRVDVLQDDIAMAKLAGRVDYGIPDRAWVPDESWTKIM